MIRKWKLSKGIALLVSIMLMATNFVVISHPISVAAEGVATYYYVSPTGSDSNDGTNIDHPLQTIEKAREAVQSINSNMQGDIIVYLMDGTYALNDTLTFNASDSGTNGHKVIYEAYTGAKPVISGGVDVSKGWTVYDAGKNIYQRTGVDWNFRQLYVNDQRGIRAREPNMTDEVTGGPYYHGTDGGSYPFAVKPGDITPVLHSTTAEMVFNDSWNQFRGNIDYVDANNKVHFKGVEDGFAFNHHTQGNTPYFIENDLSLLDAEGEWFLDNTSHTLYYKPRSGEVMNTTSIIAPKLETVVNFEGTQGNKVQNIEFKGITIAHSTWLAPNEYGYQDMQAGFRYQTVPGGNTEIRGASRYTAPKSMVQLKYTSNIALDHNTFEYSGGWGVMGYEGTDHTSVTWNNFTKNAGGGIAMGIAGDHWDDTDDPAYSIPDGQSQYDSITDNTVDSVALEYRDMVGIGAMLPQNMTIARNEIKNLPYTGISIGWNWTDDDHGMTNNQVYLNHVHDVIKLLQDGGTIYSLGRMNGDSDIYYNYLNNAYPQSVYAPFDNVVGIYFDGASSYKKAEYNVIDNVCRVFSIAGHDNIISSNYFTRNNRADGSIDISGDDTSNGVNIPVEKGNPTVWPAKAQEIMQNVGPGSTYSMTPPPAPVDLAFNKSVTVSSQAVNETHSTSFAVDGDTSTRWAAQEGHTDWEWLDVDLGDAYSISSTSTMFELGSGYNYKIEYSTDNTNWNTYVDKTGASTTQQTNTDVKAVTARYMRITMKSSNGSSIYEFHVYAGQGGTIPVANSALSTKSITYDQNPARKSNAEADMVLNGGTLNAIKNGDTSLVPDQDYTIVWNKVFIKQSYLDTLSVGKTKLTFHFNSGVDATLEVNVLADDGTTNIGLNKTVTASSYSDTNYKENVVDGDKSTRWAAALGHTSWEWVDVDLGGSYSIKSINTLFELTKDYNYKIEYSTDNKTWNTYVNKTQTTTTEQLNRDINDVTARYVKITMKSGNGSSIYEFTIFGIPTAPVNVAQGKTVIASSVAQNEVHPASYAVDGDTNTRWAAQEGHTDWEWLDVDLGGSYSVNSINTMFERTDTAYQYKIEYSTDNNSWSTYVDNTSNATVQQRFNDVKNITARYVRITMKSGWGSSIYEFSVYGTPVQVSSITVSGANNATTVPIGSTLAMKAEILPTSAINADVDWSEVDGTGSATIDPVTGVLTGRKLGTVTVIATTKDGSGINGSTQIMVRPVPVNIALGKAVTASSEAQNETHHPSFAVDGDQNTRWAAQEGHQDWEWLDVDLGDNYSISSINTMFERTDTVYQYKIEYSTDNKNWNTYVDNTSNATVQQKFNDINYATARYVRITMKSGWGSSICEFSVYGAPVVDAVNAKTVADGVISVAAPLKDATRLTLPTVPAGYTIAIKSVTTGSAIALDGTITPPTEDTTIGIVFTVTKTADGTIADTAMINVIVPAKTIVTPSTTAATVAAGITSVAAPLKDATRLTLPVVPAGYTIAIKSVTTGSAIALDGTITPPASDTVVSLVFIVTKTADETTADTVIINVVVPAKTTAIPSNGGGTSGNHNSGGGSSSTIVVSASNVVPVITKVDGNSNVIATIDSSQIDTNIVNVIEVDQPVVGSKVQVQIPASVIGTGAGSFEINTNTASLSFPTSIVDPSLLNSGGTLQVSQNLMVTADANALLVKVPTGSRTNGKVFTFGMAIYDSNNNLVNTIHNFASGKSVTVTINLSKEDISGMDTLKMSAFYFDTTSNNWVDIGGNFDASKMTYTFNTTHFTDFTIMEKPSVSINRFAGITRIETSLNIAKEEYANSKPDSVVLATANDFADALAGSGLAYKYNAPLLLVNKTVSDSQTVMDYITTNLSKDKNIYILGEIGAVSEDIETYLTLQGYKIIRLGGKNRYETNQKIVDNLNVAKGTSLVIATGDGFADALSISSIANVKGFPILLNSKENLSASVSSYITNLQPTTICLVGGEGVLSTNIENQIKKLNGNITIVRLGGQDRYETSRMILDYFNLNTDTIAIATGVDFPDALSGSILAARKNSGVLLVDNKEISKQKELLSKEKITNEIVFGGEGVISNDIATSLIQK